MNVAVPAGLLKRLARPIYHSLYRAMVLVKCYWADRRETGLGLPPALLRFRVSESHAAKLFVDIGQRCCQIIEERIEEAGLVLTKDSRVLDFGCGCGRTIMWLIRDHPDVGFYGCDVDEEAIGWCRENLSSPGGFLTNGALPPLPYDDAYCFSVFTHLNERMQDAWLSELRRIIKPNGLLIITVYGRNANPKLTALEHSTFETLGFLHKTSQKFAGMLPEWYHTTWHSPAYITSRLLPLFETVSYIEIADGVQDCVVASGIPFNSLRGPSTPVPRSTHPADPGAAPV